MRTSSADVGVLERVGWLSLVPAPFRAKFMERGLLRRFDKGQFLYRWGDPPGGLFGLVAGVVGVAIASSQRGTAFAHIGQPGFWCGEAAVLTAQPRRVEVWAARSSATLHLPLSTLEALIAEDPETWRWLGVLAVLNLDTTLGAADDLMIRDPRRRCLAVLLRLAGHGGAMDHGRPIDVYATQDDLAAMANVSRTVASGLLREYRERNLVELHYRKIRLLDVPSLRADVRVGGHDEPAPSARQQKEPTERM